MTIKKFVAFSLVIHAVALACIYFIQVRPSEEKKPKEYMASLVTPEELQGPPVKPVPPPPRVRTLPPSPRKLTPAPSESKVPRHVLPPPRVSVIPKPELIPESPVVPGEGRETGKPLPEGVRPKGGEVGKSGESKREGETRDTGSKPAPGKPGFTGKGKLFDKGTIESIAGKDSGRSGTKAKKDEAVTFNTDDYRYQGYMKLLKQKIESIWVFPREAIARGIKFPQDLKIQFTIKKDGRLGEVRLIRTSGYKILDDAALKALKDGEPYWPLPAEWGMESYTVMGHFIYSMYGYELR